MRTLRDLLATWENWSAREVGRRALAKATTEQQREVLSDALDRSQEVDPLDVLRDTSELVAFLSGWRWQAVLSARERGATWAEIGAAIGVSAERAAAEHADAVEKHVRYGSGPGH